MTASLHRTPADPDDKADIETQRRELVVEARCPHGFPIDEGCPDCWFLEWGKDV